MGFVPSQSYSTSYSSPFSSIKGTVYTAATLNPANIDSAVVNACEGQRWIDFVRVEWRGEKERDEREMRVCVCVSIE
jgi:hypothetical protein